MNIRILTGITTSGTPHLGNYIGAIRPAIQESKKKNVECFFFLADYHALVKCKDPIALENSSREIAATWLASGLDPNRVVFYRQSDIPEILEMCWILTCFIPKGMMNRAHAYKALAGNNTFNNIESDHGVTMGLFSYPILMAADILIFGANKVPVGPDQIQHLEMSRSIAKKFNHIFRRKLFPLPEIINHKETTILPGLDGRKMSKSYGNIIPLFLGGAEGLHSAIMRIVTDSCAPGEPKNVNKSPLYALYQAFSSKQESDIFREKLELGMSWNEAKKVLHACIKKEIDPMREKYLEFIQKPALVEDILKSGAEKARKFTIPFLQNVKELIGIRAVE